MAQFQENINSIIAAFCMCARSDSNRSPLSREELRQLIQQEFTDAMENPQDPKTIKKVLCFLDDDSSCRVDFSELLSLVFRVAKACYKPLQQSQVLEEGQESREQEKTGREQLLEPCAEKRVSNYQQVPEQGVNNQVKHPENDHIQEGETGEQDWDTHQSQEDEISKHDQGNHQSQEDEMSKQDQGNHGTQEGETSKQDQDTCQTQEDEISQQDWDNHQTQEGVTSKQDQNNHQTQQDETSKQEWGIRQTQEGETSKQDPNNHQTQEGVTHEQDWDTRQDDRTEAPEGNPERSEIIETPTPEQTRNTHKAEESETPEQDPKTHQAKDAEASGEGPNHQQSPETEPAEQDMNCPSKTQERDPNNKIQVCEAPQPDPNPSETQQVLPPQQGSSPHQDPKPQGTYHDPAFYHLPESKVLEQEHGGAEAPSCPAQQQEDAHHRRQPTMEQQLLHSLYQWPLQQ